MAHDITYNHLYSDIRSGYFVPILSPSTSGSYTGNLAVSITTTSASTTFHEVPGGYSPLYGNMYEFNLSIPGQQFLDAIVFFDNIAGMSWSAKYNNSTDN